jgi:hypothetical protein
MAELIEKYEQEAVYNIAYVLAYRSEADRAFECDPRWLPFLESIGNHRRNWTPSSSK